MADLEPTENERLISQINEDAEWWSRYFWAMSKLAAMREEMMILGRPQENDDA